MLHFLTQSQYFILCVNMYIFVAVPNVEKHLGITFLKSGVICTQYSSNYCNDSECVCFSLSYFLIESQHNNNYLFIRIN